MKFSLLGCALLAVCSATGQTFELVKAPQSLADWQNGEFYAGKAAPADSPAEVFLPENTTSIVDNASVAYVGSFQMIRPRGAAALLVDVSTAAVFRAAFTPSVKTRPAERGLFIKRGTGFLQLASLGNVPRWNGATMIPSHQFDYDSDYRVEEGVLKMPDRGTGATGETITDFFLRDVTVLEGAVFAPSSSASSGNATTWLNAIHGGGSISNGVGTSGERCVFRPSYSGAAPCVFEGRLDGKMTFHTSAHLHLTGTASTLDGGGFRVCENADGWTKGILGVRKIGANSSEPSSLGKYGYVSLGEVGSRLLYLGSGETTGKFFYFFETALGKKYPSVIDAGAVGGLTFTGNWLSNTGDGYLCRLHLDGSNTTACVVESAAPAGANDGKLLYIVKKGTGTWSFTGKTQDRSAISGWAVENGVLRFDSLAERGVNCSLGACTRFYEDVWGKTDDFVQKPYCFRLGAEGSCGTLEYAGPAALFCSTRPVVLGGDGRLRNTGGARSVFQSGVSALSPGVKSLVLDGEDDGENILTDVTDGAGAVKVVKTGGGRWILSGTNNTFSGGIDVNGGTLVLQGVSGRFDWWRLTIRGLWGTGDEIQMHEFGMYDADGTRVNGGIVRDAELAGLSASSTYTPASLRRLPAGTATYGRQLERRPNSITTERLLHELFNDADLSGGGFGIQFKTPGAADWVKPREDDPETYLPIVVRHAPSAKEVRSYDLSIRHAPSYFRMPRSWLLEGSVDGETWWTVDDVSAADNARMPRTDDAYNYWWWYADTSCAAGTAGTHTGGKPIAGSTNAVAVVYDCPVSVAAGATLEAKGLVRLSSLRVDPASAGTIRGFSLAGEGSVEVTGRVVGQTELPLVLEDAVGGGNLRHWSVSVTGATGEWRARVRGGKIVVTPPAFAVLVQ